MEADAVGGITALDQFDAGVIEIVEALDLLGIDAGLSQHIGVIVNAGIAVAHGVTDLVALVVAVSGADGFPGALQLRPAVGIGIDKALERDTVFSRGVHSYVLHRTREHGGQIGLGGRAQLGVQLGLIALILDGHMIGVLALIEGVNHLL